MSKTWLSFASVLAILVACGGSSTPTQTPTGSSGGPTASDASAEPTPAPSSEPAATPAATDAGTSASADAGAAKPASTGSPIVSTSADDECLPVGVDFEKRARPKLKECYREGKKKDPNLQGTVKIKMTIDVKGKIKSVKVIEKTLPDKVADCMLKVVKATPFPEVEKCWDATLTIPMTFPTPP